MIVPDGASRFSASPPTRTTEPSLSVMTEFARAGTPLLPTRLSTWTFTTSSRLMAFASVIRASWPEQSPEM